ncbi:DUF411 domain-containing protein [Pseudomonas sp. gcc21]|uniref:DUF411 domain-containing protein n=1 Tax=Pseudomonas sp. gcc21 TaxID=2726989 RepID=UPI0014516B16|nr:DUF411 domain-containing protein [Pseudomonas sp. gcc21]QJD58334.1 DUF411 domain-containing protein [Pseudomonas sp. gcc21]
MTRLLASLVLISGLAHAGDPMTIDVHRDPNCGCCSAWIEHLEGNGFTVNDHLEDDMRSVKQEAGVPAELASCHTAIIDGRFIEGHVPAADILALSDKPDVVGLAVPGMPVGSPGMEMGDRQDAYKVIAVNDEGEQKVFNTYP